MLPAQQGDCLWIEYGPSDSPYRVLIDAGPADTYEALANKIRSIPQRPRRVDLFVVTHIDNDHIGAASRLIADRKALDLEFGDIWFNGFCQLPIDTVHRQVLGPAEASAFAAAIAAEELPWNVAFDGRAVSVTPSGLPRPIPVGPGVVTVLSPGHEQLVKLRAAWARVTERELLRDRATPRALLAGDLAVGDIDALADAMSPEDDAVPNGSSIAVMVEYGGRRALFGADAHPGVLVDGLARLSPDPTQLDAFKLPHHGSRANVTVPLLRQVRCQNYLISTSGRQTRHPNPEAIARIVKYGGQRPTLSFNYRNAYSEPWHVLSVSPDSSYEFSIRLPSRSHPLSVLNVGTDG
jgi:hypothetical protein